MRICREYQYQNVVMPRLLYENPYLVISITA